ncbi:DUF2231 domain-containing protein [Alicyclobacillus kakegawensis]|uniref:DUF2231 domain-containing protein n=1 Tax=Alicyclobacillus kakegawensis TaxID=392012 RepID=UPI0008371B7E|nr:DUF2231 domain-containing protein [Alicyclobacillus kakegawensis]
MTSLYHLFPSTIHPMVVHLTIAVNYICTLAGVIGLIRRKDEFWSKAFFYMLILSILSTLAAGLAGVISESYLHHIPHTVSGMFHKHKEYGELTGVLLIVSFVIQTVSIWRARAFRVSVFAFLFCLVSTILVSLAGHLGGTLVYSYGLGVR